MDSNNSFETSLSRLEELAKKISDPAIALDEAIHCYEEGLKEYKTCKAILDDAKQKIETIEEGK